uniref:Uncharacterized protein n=1 Tax=Anabas testudineus TaxID=64144 RepID=A0AAQ6ITU2_ANATE
MMKMSGRVTVSCLALLLTMTSVSAVRRLNSIRDLSDIDFGQTVPEQCLVLLYWLASTVEIDNNVIWLTFDPNNVDYGSHHYGNFEGLLDQFQGHRYYSVGNIYKETSVQLPAYYVNNGNEDRNRARIILGFRRVNAGRQQQRIEAVYITQHFWNYQGEGTKYDPQHTYEISMNLLREIREVSVRGNQMPLAILRDRYARNINEFQLNDIRNNWGNLAGLGLLLFIVMQRRYDSNHIRYRHHIQHRQNDNAMLICCVVLVFLALLFLLLNSSQPKSRWQ